MVDNIEELKDVIARAIEGGGAIVSHNGPFITGSLHFNNDVSKQYPNQLYRDLAAFMRDDDRIEDSLIPATDDGIRKLIYILKEQEIVQDVTLQEHRAGNLDKQDIVLANRVPAGFRLEEYIASFSFEELAANQFTRNIYGLPDDADMSWLEATDEAIINSLRGFQNKDATPTGLESFRRPTADIPEAILAPYRVQWPESADESEG